VGNECSRHSVPTVPHHRAVQRHLAGQVVRAVLRRLVVQGVQETNVPKQQAWFFVISMIQSGWKVFLQLLRVVLAGLAVPALPVVPVVPEFRGYR
jgi:hypothetical protein